MLKRSLLTLLTTGSFFLIFSGTAASSVSEVDKICEITQARQFLENFFPRYKFENATIPDFEVKDVSKLNLKNFSICQVVFRTVYNVPEEKKTPYMKNDEKLFKIGYILGPDAFMLGDLFVKKEEGFQNLTFVEFRKYNEEYFRSLEKESPDRSVSSALIQEAIRQADVSFDKKKKVSVIIYVDPYCPYCHRVLDMVKKYQNEINLYILFTPVLGPRSMDVSVNALCVDKNERFSAFLEKRTGNKCESGEKKIQKNLELFARLQAEGVPVILFYRDGAPTGEKFIGAMPEQEFVKKIR